MKKLFVLLGLVLLVFGVVAVTYSTLERSTTEEAVWTWDSIYPSTLNPPSEPDNSTFAGTYLANGCWFELDLSFSGPVRVSIYAMEQGEAGMVSMFNEVGERFTQKVWASGGGTFNIEIRNEGSFAVDIATGSQVVAKRNVTTNLVLYPYRSIGVLVALVGLCLLLFGLVAKGRPKPRRSTIQKA